jgi:hypothetical protein
MVDGEPSPEDAALATLIAFGLQDLWAVRELMKSFLEAMAKTR